MNDDLPCLLDALPKGVCDSAIVFQYWAPWLLVLAHLKDHDSLPLKCFPGAEHRQADSALNKSPSEKTMFWNEAHRKQFRPVVRHPNIFVIKTTQHLGKYNRSWTFLGNGLTGFNTV